MVQTLLGVVDRFGIVKSGPGARLRPLFQASEDKTRWVTLEEEFPNSGVVSWWQPSPEAESNKAWIFQIEPSWSYDADNEPHDYYGAKGSPSPAVELIDLSMAADTEDTRAFLLEEGLSPERCASKRLVFRDRSGSVVGPLEVWPRRGGEVDFSPNAVFLKRILREVREMTPSVIDSAKVSKGDKTAADAAR